MATAVEYREQSEGAQVRCIEEAFAFDRFESEHACRIGFTLAKRESGNTRRCDFFIIGH
jgi:hypothetical protein